MIDVAYACDDNYIVHTGISLISLFENNPYEITVHLIDMGISEQSMNDMRGIVESYNHQLKIYDFSRWENELPVSNTGRHTKSVYAKLFFGRIENIDRILYIDSDTVVVGDISPLFSSRLDGYVAGVNTISSKSRNSAIGLGADEPYLNDGVLLMNLSAWRNDGLEDKAFQYIRECDGNPPVLSEGTINHICRGRCVVLPPQFNLLSGIVYFSRPDEIARMTGRPYYSTEEVGNAIAQPVIIHYLSAFYKRPWQLGCTHPLKDYYLKYKAMSPWKNVELDSIGGLPIKLQIINVLHRLLPSIIFTILYKMKKHR